MTRQRFVALFNAPRRVFALLLVLCISMLLFGMYLQHVVGLEPCPMCVVQRYALLLVALTAAAGSARSWPRGVVVFWLLLLLESCFGAFVAGRQSWLQWFPPAMSSCGRDIYGMIENFPLNRVIPMIFKGSGDCSAVDWTFLGGSIANWSFVCFTSIAVLSLYALWLRWRHSAK